MEEQHDPNGFAGDILRRVTHRNSRSMVISRVPLDVRERFIKLADDEFVGDWGMTLKWLMDGLLTEKEAALELRIAKLEERLIETTRELHTFKNSIASEMVEEAFEEIKSVNGSVIGRRRKRT